MLVVSYGIFHKRRRKIMALIPSKARAGIAAVTFAAAVMPFVLATPAKAITIIKFLDVSETVQMTVNDAVVPGQIDRQVGEFIHTRSFDTQDPNIKDGALGGIVFAEPFTVDEISDILWSRSRARRGDRLASASLSLRIPTLAAGPSR